MQILPCFLVSVAEATVLGINTHSIVPIPGQFEMIKRAGKYHFKIFVCSWALGYLKFILANYL